MFDLDNQEMDQQTAEAAFDQWGDAMDLDLDTSKMDAEDITSFGKLKTRLVRAIQRGHLVFNEDSEAVYTPHNRRSRYKEAITFRERSGASLMAMDRTKKNEDMKKTYMVMADITGLHEKTFAGLHGTDIKVCEALFQLLMD
jgi:hypothetical protein